MSLKKTFLFHYDILLKVEMFLLSSLLRFFQTRAKLSTMKRHANSDSLKFLIIARIEIRASSYDLFVEYLSRYSVPSMRVVSDKYANLEVSVACSAAHRSSNSYDLLSRTLNLTREVASTRQQTYSTRSIRGSSLIESNRLDHARASA